MRRGLFERMDISPSGLDPARLKALAKKAAGEGGEYLDPDLPPEKVDNSPAAIAKRKKAMAEAEEWSAAATTQNTNADWVKGVGGKAERPESLKKNN